MDTDNLQSQTTVEQLQEENKALKMELAKLRMAYDEIRNNAIETSILLEEMPLGEIVLDKSGTFLACNEKFAGMLGYKISEIVGKNFAFSLYDGFNKYRETFPQFKAATLEDSLNWVMRKKDGGVVYTVLYPKAKLTENGEFIQGRGYLIDVTERTVLFQALQKSEAEKDIILQSMTESIAYYDKDMCVKWANENAAKLLKTEMKKLIGTKCHDSCKMNKDYCKFCPMTLAKQKMKSHSDELYIDDNFQIAMTATPLKDDAGQFIGMVQMVSDITDNKLMEKRISDISNLERRKIGQDIHDGICQIITGVVFMVSALQAEFENTGYVKPDDIEAIAEHIKSAQIMLRGLVQGLCPVGIDPQGLMNAIKNLTENMQLIYRIKCELKIHGRFTITNYDTANHLYLIVQEILMNAAKHSQCSMVKISIRRINGMMMISIHDDGTGFQIDPSKRKGMGIRIIKNRAMSIGAMLSIKSSAKRGTQIIVSLPANNLNNGQDEIK